MSCTGANFCLRNFGYTSGVMDIRLASFFSGAGGLDLGFEMAGYTVAWANEFDKAIWSSYERNFPDTTLEKRSITDLSAADLPDQIDGMIGGPPCQSWSEAGALRGINDHRGQLFLNYMEMIRAARPKFFLAENVSGILAKRHEAAFQGILRGFAQLGYNVSFSLLNSNDYGVPQDRERVIIVGYRSDLEKFFIPPSPESKKPVLKDAIYDLRDSAVPTLDGNKSNPNCKVPNHEFMTGGFSTIYMSRNRVRPWNKPSFTIQAGGRHAPLHPQAPEMVTVGKDQKKFVDGKESLYRRLSVRECARIQTFPDKYIFDYQNVADGYKMVGNAVPVNFAQKLALQILQDVSEAPPGAPQKLKTGAIKSLITKGSKLRLEAE